VRLRSTSRRRQREAGIALLISIFILLLISVVGISLIVSSGTESALAGNYRSSTDVYYAALSGLEEARSRLLGKNPSSFKNTSPGFLPAPGVTMPVGSIAYVLNPDPTRGENAGNLFILYPDAEYDKEFGPGRLAIANAANLVQTTPSVWNANPLNAVNGTMPGPSYKWVRINPVSEVSMNLDVDADGRADSITELYYDSTNRRFSNNPGTGPEILEVTSLAQLPNGSQRLLQYLVTPAPITLPPFLAALTLMDGPGNTITYHPPASNASYSIKGDDQDCSGVLTGTKYPAIGVFNNADKNAATSQIPLAFQPSYTGVINPGPDVERIDGSFPANLQTPSQLDAVVQSIAQSADVTIPSGPITYPLPTVTGSSLTSLGMSPSNPLTVVINGNLDISNWSRDAYGLLLVTGTFIYDPDTTWNGIILVIGQGNVAGSHLQFKQINGGVFVAKTRDAAGNLLANLGGASVVFADSMQGNGIRYSSCWINKSVPAGGYKILSFHEIPQ